jgi:hypothetical protein
MINAILDQHSKLKKGQTVKICNLEEYTHYINRTDLVKSNGDVLLVYRANGAIVAINTKYTIMSCVIERMV